MNRRAFLQTLGAIAASAPLLPRLAHARGSDTPVKGGHSSDKVELVEAVKLPAWPHGPTSAATNAMLMFRGNPTHTYYGNGEIPSSQPKVLWKHRMGDFKTLYYGKPFTWRGTGWTGQALTYANHVWIGSQGRGFYCFEQDTGKLKWRYDSPRQFKGSACFWDNKIYTGNVDDWLRCIDATNGKVLWRLNTGYDLDSSPCVVDGRLYIAGENGHVRCLDPHTGQMHWKAFVGGINRGTKTGSYGSETSPAVVGDEVYAATYDGELFNLNRADGKKRWVAKTGDDTDVSPVIWEDLVFIAAQDQNPYLFAFNRKDGSQVWKHRAKGGYWSTPAVVDGALYVGTAGGLVEKHDARTGKVQWSYKLGGSTWSSPAVIGKRLVIGDREGLLHCVDTQSGKALWKLKLGGRIHSTPTVQDGRIFVGTTDGFFFGIG